MSTRESVIWVDITGYYCAEGIDDWWAYTPREDDFGEVLGKEWLAFRKSLMGDTSMLHYKRDAYEWRVEYLPVARGTSYGHAGVYLRSLRPGADWLWVLSRLPDGVREAWQETHPYVTFHYEEPDNG